jgi:hypothetical protein
MSRRRLVHAHPCRPQLALAAAAVVGTMARWERGPVLLLLLLLLPVLAGPAPPALWQGARRGRPACTDAGRAGWDVVPAPERSWPDAHRGEPVKMPRQRKGRALRCPGSYLGQWTLQGVADAAQGQGKPRRCQAEAGRASTCNDAPQQRQRKWCAAPGVRPHCVAHRHGQQRSLQLASRRIHAHPYQRRYSHPAVSTHQG